MATSRVLLIGDPVAHSLSPAMQNAAFRAAGIDAVYEARRVTSAELGAVVQELHREPWLGANVTIPHKEAVLGLVDAIAPLVERIGAANTLVRDGDRVRAENTDVRGFAEALREAGIDPRGRRAVVLGAGGASRAVVAALLDAPVGVDVAARDRKQAEGLAASFPRQDVSATEWPRDLRGYGLVVNATPLGMRGEDPLPGMALAKGLVVVDLVPIAEETPLVRRAKAAGCVTIDGLPMLLHQAAASFELWTGRRAPLDAMRRALPRAA
jgi:shikimate dehydrogenase